MQSLAFKANAAGSGTFRHRPKLPQRPENVDLLLYPKISSEAVVLAEKGFVVISVSGALSGLRSGRKL
jgi:hypothetical protein